MNKPPTHPHTPEMNTEEGHLGNAFAHSATEITHKTTSAKWKMCPPKVLLHLKITPHWPHSTSSSKLSLFKKNISSHSIWLVLSTFSSNETVFVEPLFVKMALTFLFNGRNRGMICRINGIYVAMSEAVFRAKSISLLDHMMHWRLSTTSISADFMRGGGKSPKATCVFCIHPPLPTLPFQEAELFCPSSKKWRQGCLI